MKLCNFRPLCVIALLAALTSLSCLIAPWLAVVVGLGVGVWLSFTKTPLSFKLTALTVYAAVVISFVLHTAFNPEPVYRTYDPDAGLRGVVLRYANKVLHHFLSDTNAELLFSMMFGDKSGLPWLVRQNFSLAGIAHLLVVSGLHVGLLVGVLIWLLQVMRVPRHARIYCLTPLLLFYAYLCGWQYAVLRTTIMCLVYELANRQQRKVDPLTALSVAATIILILFPYSLKSASFMLTFSCVLGIIFFYRTLRKFVPGKLLPLYLAVNIGSLPFAIYCFGVVSIYGAVANLVLVPLLVAAYYVGMLAVCTYVAGCALLVIDPLLSIAIDVCSGIAHLPNATLLVGSPASAIILYLVGLLLLSRFVLISRKVKYPLATLLFACYFLLLVV